MAKRWYVVHTYSGYENKVKTDLEHRIETYGRRVRQDQGYAHHLWSRDSG